MSTFLFELGVEELPPKYVADFAKGWFKQFFNDELKNNSFPLDIEKDVSFFITPRRIAVQVTFDVPRSEWQLFSYGESKNEESRLEEDGKVKFIKRFGPKVKALTDKPAVGFAKSCGIEPEALEQDEQGRVFCEIRIEAKHAKELFPQLIKNSFDNINKTVGMRFMHWADRDDLFIRPVKWLVCMHDSEIIPMEWLGLSAGNTTRGHRFHGSDQVVIETASQYEDLMQQQFVIANYEKRKALILSQLKAIESERSAEVIIEDDLLDEVTSINEWPKAVLCNFNEEFLEVPQEALIESMQSHQKCFALKDNSGKIQPHFITIANIQSQEPQSLIHGNEKVMTARLSDARFFYETDIKKSLDEFNEKNKTVTFQKQLGSVQDKTDRVVALTKYIAEQTNADVAIATRAAQYANADLRSSMVYEFTELQGIMGKYYALKQGEKELVANSIEQRYWPRFADDATPETNEAASLALADRIDTLVGIFGINLKPTGSKDPYSLRRAAIGIIRIIQERELKLNLSDVISESLKTYQGISLQEQTTADVKEFILKRLEDIYIKEYQGDKRTIQILRSVLACQQEDIVDLDVRFKALRSFIDLPDLPVLAEANKRVKNLLQKSESEIPQLNKDLLKEADEIALADSFEKISAQVANEKDYVKKFKVLCEFAKPLSNFFDNVMVMVDDNTLKINRLALLKGILDLFLDLADISYLS